MLKFTPVEELFAKKTPFTKEQFSQKALDHMKSTVLAGVSDDLLQVSGQEGGSGGMIVKRVDPFAAKGYRAFQSEQEYNEWLSASLYEPTQGEIEEALNRGDGS